jgi:ABC-type antimicrobial peptide transport system permease subunit
VPLRTQRFGKTVNEILILPMLHGVVPGDPATLALVTATVLAAAILAAILPALRAGRAEPMHAMRE